MEKLINIYLFSQLSSITIESIRKYSSAYFFLLLPLFGRKQAQQIMGHLYEVPIRNFKIINGMKSKQFYKLCQFQ